MAINGEEYGWQDIKIIMLGRPVAGVLEISYEVEREKKNVYAIGSKPIARARGVKKYTGKIKVLQSELQALQTASGINRDLTDIGMFSIVAMYVPNGSVGIPVTDTLNDCEFTKVPKGMKQGDLNMEVELELIIGDIEFGV